jgi:hypothetical protein
VCIIWCRGGGYAPFRKEKKRPCTFWFRPFFTIGIEKYIIMMKKVMACIPISPTLLLPIKIDYLFALCIFVVTLSLHFVVCKCAFMRMMSWTVWIMWNMSLVACWTLVMWLCASYVIYAVLNYDAGLNWVIDYPHACKRDIWCLIFFHVSPKLLNGLSDSIVSL